MRRRARFVGMETERAGQGGQHGAATDAVVGDAGERGADRGGEAEDAEHAIRTQATEQFEFGAQHALDVLGAEPEAARTVAAVGVLQVGEDVL